VDTNTLIILGFIVSFLTGISSAIMFINLRYLLKYRPRLNRRQREKIRAFKSKGYYTIPTK
jgi:hypothetical protein